MSLTIESVFNEAEKRYLSADELGIVTQYVSSLNDRLALYRTLREQEVTWTQVVVNQLQQQFAQTDSQLLEQVIKNGLLALRSCSMAMLLKDDSYIQERIAWLKQAQANYKSQAIDTAFYHLLNQQLQQNLSPQHMALLQSSLTQVQTALGQTSGPMAQPEQESQLEEELSMASLFQ
jgi:hypothetical protein